MSSSFIFLSYARENQNVVQQLYLLMKDAGLEPWMDKPPNRYLGIQAGDNWRNQIKARIKEASFVLVFLSKAAETDDGFFWEEIRCALDELSVKPNGMTCLIPILIEKCQVPPVTSSNLTLESLHWHDLQELGMANLVEYLKAFSGNKIEPAHLTLVHAASGGCVSSSSLLIRGTLAAFRQNFHLTGCPNLADHLSGRSVRLPLIEVLDAAISAPPGH